MHQFTDKDIFLIKEKIISLIKAIKYYNFDLKPYIILGIIYKAECDAIMNFIQDYSFDFCKNLTPLALPLQPLIRVARHIISNECEQKIIQHSWQKSSYERRRYLTTHNLMDVELTQIYH